jgi:hypothetical protein
VKPVVTEIKEKRITREIHEYDVLHRIQPIIDVEVLPTKHYVPDPSGKGLIEVPESALPGRHTKYDVIPRNDNVVRSVPGANGQPPASTSEQTIPRKPVVTSEQNSVINGVPRSERSIRYPPSHETGGFQTGQTVPLHMHDTYDSTSDSYRDSSDAYRNSSEVGSIRRSTDGEPLFQDSDHAFGGRLPGLEDRNPVVTGAVPASKQTAPVLHSDGAGEGEATKALRRRQAEVTKKMAGLSVEE